jgi:hypothetical protein
MSHWVIFSVFDHRFPVPVSGQRDSLFFRCSATPWRSLLRFGGSFHVEERPVFAGRFPIADGPDDQQSGETADVPDNDIKSEVEQTEVFLHFLGGRVAECRRLARCRQ